MQPKFLPSHTLASSHVLLICRAFRIPKPSLLPLTASSEASILVQSYTGFSVEAYQQDIDYLMRALSGEG